MSPAFRAMFTFFSYLIFAAACAIWVRSYWHADSALWERNHFTFDMHTGTHITAAASQGTITVSYQRIQGHIADNRMDSISYKHGPNGEIIGVEVAPRKPAAPDRTSFTTVTTSPPGCTTGELAMQTLAGFGFSRFLTINDERYSLSFPTWLLVALVAFVPLRTIDSFIRSRKQPPKQPRHEMFAT